MRSRPVSEIFREVDEDVQRDRYAALWQRFRWLVIGALVALVGGTIAYTAWTSYSASVKVSRGERFLAAATLAEAGRNEEAARAFAAFAEEANAGYAALARLREAAALSEAGDQAGAIAVYDRIARDGGVNEMFRELAAVLAAQRLLDSEDPAAAEQRLAEVAGGAGPWRHLARELQGVAALQSGRTAEASAIFGELAEEAGVPAGVKSRATELRAAIGE
jgi:hypothetical protein